MEPTYEYIKGQGWVLANHPSGVISLACGTVVRITMRKPLPGEYYDASWFTSGYWVSASERPNWRAWSKVDFKHLPVYPQHDGKYDFDFYVVFERL